MKIYCKFCGHPVPVRLEGGVWMPLECQGSRDGVRCASHRGPFWDRFLSTIKAQAMFGELRKAVAS